MRKIGLTVLIIVMMLGFVSVKEIASDADIVTAKLPFLLLPGKAIR